MRKILSLFMLFYAFSLSGQEHKNPDYYLNGQKINFEKVFVNMSRIDSIYVDKQPNSNGTIRLFTKNRAFIPLSLNQVLTKYSTLTGPNDSLLFMINGKVLEDVSDIQIDDSYFINLDVMPLSNVKYLDRILQNLSIVKIDLDQKPKPIMIR